MKTFLSIDWDYFIGASAKERMLLFPDGGNENLPAFVLDIIWASRYGGSVRLAEQHKDIRKIEVIGVLDKELQVLTEYIEKWGVPVIVAESHSEAYGVFRSRLGAKEKCDIVNIDYHHDVYMNREGFVDCGNWLSELFRVNKLNNLIWVARDDSDELPKQHAGNKQITIRTDFEAVLSEMAVPECVFICRSGAWSPPHLDARLNDLLEKVYSEPLPDRYTNEFKEGVKWDIEQMSNILK